MLKRKMLVVSDRYPFPPRDGVTYPIVGQIQSLIDFFDIDILLVLDNKTTKTNPKLFKQDVFKHHFILENNYNKLNACKILNEFTLKQMSFLVSVPNKDILRNIFKGHNYDIIYTGLYRMAAWPPSIATILKKKPKLIININDSLTESYRRHLDLALSDYPLGMRRRLAIGIKGLRSFYYSFLEKKTLITYDLILVQTRRDKNAIIQDCGKDFTNKTIIVTNGYKKELFDIEYKGAEKLRLLLFGTLGPDMFCMFEWFYKKVFLDVKRSIPSLKLDVVGMVPQNYYRKLQKYSDVRVRDYVDDISEAFYSVSMMVSIKYMRGGFLNKVLDSMTAGVPCIGITAFNGFEGFKNGIHGFSVNTDKEYCKVLKNTLSNHELLKQVSKNARSLARQYSWKATTKIFIEKIIECNQIS